MKEGQLGGSGTFTVSISSDSGGTLNTNKISGTTNTSIASSNSLETDETLQKYVEELKLAEESLRKALNSITELRKENDRLENTIYRYKNTVTDLEYRLKRQTENNQQTINSSGLTIKDLKFILSKIHPDKNPGSTMANYLTTKIINIKRRYE
tara:strand:+ start:2103 stop:2561 length:459 start_codon:yes stop_codon:yes gene_type:complete